jgi:mannose/fructose/N-acetylgalactosamine-specific phosphotransferase system component IIB
VISMVRVDNRLIHGQVIEAWLPRIRANRVVVADDEASHNPLVRAAMALAVPKRVEVQIEPLLSINYADLTANQSQTLLLIRDVAGVISAWNQGLRPTKVNLGNIHYGPGRRKVSPSVYLAKDELEQLKILTDHGIEVEARAVPTDPPLDYARMVERFGKGS